MKTNEALERAVLSGVENPPEEIERYNQLRRDEEGEGGGVERGPRTELALETLSPQATPPIAEPPEPVSRWSRNQTLRLTQAILATRGVLPQMVRIWKRSDRIEIGMEKGTKKILLGFGPDYQRAFENVFINPIKAREEALAVTEGMSPPEDGDAQS